MVFLERTSSKRLRLKKHHIGFGILLLYIIACQSCMMMRTTPKETRQFFASSKVAFTDKTVLVDGHSIHYIETGESRQPTLLFVHGSPGSWDAFKRYLTDSLLLSKYRMIAVDRPGFGYSGFGTAASLQMQTKILGAFMQQVGYDNSITLIGHSLGGTAIVQMAAEDPDRYDHIVVLAGSVDPKAETSELWRPIIKTKPLRYLIPGALRPSNDELWLLKSDLFVLQPLLKNITCDVTIIHGTNDQLVPYSNVAFMEKEFKNAKSIDIIAIENANHFIPWEHFGLIRDQLYKLK